MKFESTKSLASTSSRSLGGALSENGDREATLQNVLTYIAEQQKYMSARSTNCPGDNNTREFNIEAPPQQIEEINTPEKSRDENYVTLKQLCDEYGFCNEPKETNPLKQNIAYAEEVCLVTPLDLETENCSNMTEHPVDICASVVSPEYPEMTSSDLTKSGNSESQTSSSDTVVSRIPRRKPSAPLAPSTPKSTTKPTKSRIPHKTGAKSPRRRTEASPPPVSSVIEGSPNRAVSFHERASSKDVIDELNRMIKNGDECLSGHESGEAVNTRLDEACQPTGWVHVEHDIDLTDPKVLVYSLLLLQLHSPFLKSIFEVH